MGLRRSGPRRRSGRHGAPPRNRATTIGAPVEQVWPWLAQLGHHSFGRAGWYAVDVARSVTSAAARRSICWRTSDCRKVDFQPSTVTTDIPPAMVPSQRSLVDWGGVSRRHLNPWVFARVAVSHAAGRP
jgi:hypothetical protein